MEKALSTSSIQLITKFKIVRNDEPGSIGQIKLVKELVCDDRANNKHELKLRRILNKNVTQSNQSTISKSQRSVSRNKYSNPALDYRHNILQTARDSNNNSLVYENSELKPVPHITTAESLRNLKSLNQAPQTYAKRISKSSMSPKSQRKTKLK